MMERRENTGELTEIKDTRGGLADFVKKAGQSCRGVGGPEEGNKGNEKEIKEIREKRMRRKNGKRKNIKEIREKKG